MPQRGNERNMVEGGKAKPREIDRGDDPEPLFELEPGRAQAAFVAAPALRCNVVVKSLVGSRQVSILP